MDKLVEDSNNFEDFYNTYKNIYNDRSDKVDTYRTKLLKEYKKNFLTFTISYPFIIYFLEKLTLKFNIIDLSIICITLALILTGIMLYAIFHLKDEYRLKYRKKLKCIFLDCYKLI